MSRERSAAPPRRLKVAVTRDEPEDGALSTALRDLDFDPVRCIVMEDHPPTDVAALKAAADSLDRFDWVICSSARAVKALVGARSGPWPSSVRTAAVGSLTADALVGAGATPKPLVGDGEGAESLWTSLSRQQWKGRRVLLPTVPGGRRLLGQALRAAGAIVEEIDAYRMLPRSADRILADWTSAHPDAVVIASPSVATALVEAIGASQLSALEAVIAIGPTTSASLTASGVRHHVSPRADFLEVARCLAALRKT